MTKEYCGFNTFLIYQTFEADERKKQLMIIDEVSIPQNASYG